MGVPHCSVVMPKTECSQCGVKVANMKQHRKIMHSKDQTPFYCDICGKSCKNNHQLKLHTKYTHVVEDNLACDICNKSCQNNLKLKQHIRTQHKTSDENRSNPSQS